MKRLFVLFALCLVLWPDPAARAAGEVLSASEAAKKMGAGEITLIDVRSPEEWRHGGIAAGAKRVTIHDPAGAEGFLRAMLRAVDGNRAKPGALICARGNRSSRAYRFLVDHGFQNLFNVKEGMLGNGAAPGWIARGLPVERCEPC